MVNGNFQELADRIDGITALAKGDKGDPGLNGTNGVDGAKGADGTNGINGTNGVDGTNGIDGSNGVDGIGVTLIDTAAYKFTGAKQTFNVRHSDGVQDITSTKWDTEVRNYNPGTKPGQTVVTRERSSNGQVIRKQDLTYNSGANVDTVWVQLDSYDLISNTINSTISFPDGIVTRKASTIVGQSWGSAGISARLNAGSTVPIEGHYIDTRTVLEVVNTISVNGVNYSDCLKTETRRSSTSSLGNTFTNVSWQCKDLGLVKAIQVTQTVLTTTSVDGVTTSRMGEQSRILELAPPAVVASF